MIPRLRLSQPLPKAQAFHSDFERGLDLETSPFNLQNASGDACDVDWQPGGGWCARGSVKSFSPTNLPTRAVHMNYYETATLRYAVTCLQDGSVWTCAADGSASGQLIAAGGSPKSTVQVNSKLYILDPGVLPRSWDGTTLTSMAAPGYNAAAVGSPTRTTGIMPIGTYGMVFEGQFHLAGMLEGGTYYANRVRQSDPIINLIGEQSWHSDAWFDITTADADKIVGMAPVGAKGFVIRDHSVFELKSTTSSIAWFPQQLATTIGAAGPAAFTSHDEKLWMYDSLAGLHYISGYEGPSGIDRGLVRGPLNKLIEDGLIVTPENAAVIGCGRRIIVSVNHVTKGRITYAYDRELKTWTCYSFGLGPGAGFTPNGATKNECLAVAQHNGCPPRFVKLDQPAGADECGTPIHYRPYVVTPWINGKDPIGKKHFECLTVIYETSSTGTTGITVGRDYAKGSQEAVTLPGIREDLMAVAKTTMERRSPGAEPTPVACSPLANQTTAFAESGTTKTIRVGLRNCASQSIQFTFKAPLPLSTWCVRAFSVEYSPDARQC